MLPDPPLGDERVRLRPIGMADVPAIVDACQDPLIPRFTEIPTPYTELEARGWVEGHAALQAAGQALDLAISQAGEQRMVGAIGLTRPLPVPEGPATHRETGDAPLRSSISLSPEAPAAAEIGYWIAREARGRGLASGALALLSDWALDALGLDRLELLILPVNAASLRVAERAGFTRAGRARPERLVGGRRQTLERWVRLAEHPVSRARHGRGEPPSLLPGGW